MLKVVADYFEHLRARWRWQQGRCPVCNRNLYAVFAYYMASHPHCFCAGETHADGQFWRKYQRTLVPKVLDVPLASIPETADELKNKDKRADVVRWEGEGGSLRAMPR